MEAIAPNVVSCRKAKAGGSSRETGRRVKKLQLIQPGVLCAVMAARWPLGERLHGMQEVVCS